MVQWPQRLVVASLWVLIIENRIFWLLSWRITFPTILQVVFRLFHLISIISHFLSGQGLAIESGHSNISCRHSWRNPIARLLSVYNYLMDGRVINNISREIFWSNNTLRHPLVNVSQIYLKQLPQHVYPFQCKGQFK